MTEKKIDGRINNGGAREGSGRKVSEIETKVVKAYPTLRQREQLIALAARANMSLSSYLIECGLAGIIVDENKVTTDFQR